MRRLRSAMRLPALAAFLFTAAQLVTGAAAAQPAKPAAGSKSNAVSRGQYLVAIMSCNDCHTPLKMGASGPEPDMTRLLSGHPEGIKLPPPPAPSGPWIWSGVGSNSAFAGPWGITYSANLTPEKNTGLGIWTDAMFVTAMRQGKHMATSRPIQPPMPWQWIGKATDEDLKAIFAYLKSVPPIANHVPVYQEPPTPAGAAKKPAEPAKK